MLRCKTSLTGQRQRHPCLPRHLGSAYLNKQPIDSSISHLSMCQAQDAAPGYRHVDLPPLPTHNSLQEAAGAAYGVQLQVHVHLSSKGGYLQVQGSPGGS